jgi:hypothetical protein
MVHSSLLKSQPRSVPLLNPDAKYLHEMTSERLRNPPLSQGEYWKTVVPRRGIPR